MHRFRKLDAAGMDGAPTDACARVLAVPHVAMYKQQCIAISEQEAVGMVACVGLAGCRCCCNRFAYRGPWISHLDLIAYTGYTLPLSG